MSGLGLALAFVPMSIGAFTGVGPTDACVASGLINTSQQIGGALGVAAMTTIATTLTSHYVASHPGTGPLAGVALVHRVQGAFCVLAASGAVVLESKPPQSEASLSSERAHGDEVAA